MHHEAEKWRNACRPLYFAATTGWPLLSRFGMHRFDGASGDHR
jgi:hypothetical protein